jgi:hypothetical protein
MGVDFYMHPIIQVVVIFVFTGSWRELSASFFARVENTSEVAVA